MERTVDDFQQAATELGITRWNIHDCSICGYKCGYVIGRDRNVFYDSGCNCVTYGPALRLSSWDDLAAHYNGNAGREDAEVHAAKYPGFVNVILKMNDFWGFENPAFLTKQTAEVTA